MKQKKNKIVLRVIAGIGIALLIIIIAALVLFRNELRSLMSLKKVDDYGMYQMTYYGDYEFDDFLETGAENDADIEALLADVGIFDGNRDKLQWSVLYNLTTGYGDIFANRKTNNIIGFNRLWYSVRGKKRM